MKCPVCPDHELTKECYEGKINFRCSGCGGRLATLSCLRSLCADRTFPNMLWQAARYGDSVDGPVCGSCRKTMRQVTVPLAGTEFELDICCSCQIIWFDPSELEQIPLPEPAKAPEELPQRAKELLAMRQIEMEEARLNTLYREPDCGAPDAAWKYVLAVLGMPVEQESVGCSRPPVITWSIAILCLAVFILTFRQMPEAIADWGFIPAQWSRYGGLTVITSMFLHAGVIHLLGNLYFLLIFGDNVEDEFGHLKYSALLAASGLCALLLHSALDPYPDVPCVGASGFISGVIACYAICFPRAKLSFMIFRGRYALAFGLSHRCWFTIPAWGAFAIWIGFQILMAAVDHDIGGTAYMAHIGGLLPGVLIAIHHRFRRKSRDELRSLTDLENTRN